MDMKRQQFKRQLKKQKWTRIALLTFISIISAVAVAFISLRIYAQVAGAPALTVPKASIFYDSQDNQIGDYYTEERRYWTSLDNMSPYLIDATVAVEDKDFFDHNGFDYSRIAGALVADLKAGAMVQGASTLTMQYARNLYLTHDKTWSRKINEALYAYRLERFYSKEEILEGYLNTVYYGHGMYGVEAASRYFYGKSAKDLTLAEASMLAGVPKGPTYYSPTVDFERAKNRQHVILQLMVEQGKITADEQQKAANEQLVFKNEEWVASKKTAPYFIDAALAEAEQILADKGIAFAEGGWKIRTTLNQAHQQAAEKAVANNMPQNELQVGFISLDVDTGYITALVGGRNYADSYFNRAVTAERQPGSAIKPILYAAALENGYNPLTMLDVSKTTFKYDNGRKEYTPQNVNEQFADRDMSMAQALAISDNVYAVKTLDDIGYDTFREILQRFELNYSKVDNPAIALGSTETSLLDLTSAYNAIAAGGKKRAGTTILSITNSKGEVVYEHKPSDEPLLSEQDAFLLTTMMTGMFDATLSDYSPATGVSIRGKMTHTYAGKTGRTKSDQWMIGFTPSITAGVWNGFDKGRNLTAQSDLAATKHIWIDFMETVHAGTANETFEVPDGVVEAIADVKTGLLATEACSQQHLVYVKAEDVPTENCTSNTIFENGFWDSILDLFPIESWLDRFRE